MKNRSLTDSFAELNDVVKQYIDARIRLLKLKLLDKLTRTGTLIITSIIVIMAVCLVVLLLAFAFSFWYASNYGSLAEGMLISSVFLVLLALIIFWLRKPIITNVLVKRLAELIFDEEENESE